MATLGVGTVLGWSSAKLGRRRLKRTPRIEQTVTTCFAGGAGGAGAEAAGGIGDGAGGVAAGVGIQLLKMSRSFEMAVSCSWWIVAGASLIAQERKLSACTMRSPSLTVGCER